MSQQCGQKRARYPRAGGRGCSFSKPEEQRWERGWGGFERLNSKCNLAGLGKQAAAQIFLSRSILGGRWLINIMDPGIMGGFLPKESMVPSQKLPESGQFLHRPPEASVSCPISEYLRLYPLFCISMMPRMKGSWFVKAHQCKINKMYSNPVMVLFSPRDFNMIFQGYKQTFRAPVAKKTFKNCV